MTGVEIVIKTLSLAGKDRKKYPSLRKGQSIFNALCDVAPGLAESVRGTDLDPYYVDQNLPKLLDWLYQQSV